MDACTAPHSVGTWISALRSSTLTVLAPLLVASFALPLRAEESAAGTPRVSEQKIALVAADGDPDLGPPALCGARIAEGSSELALLCRHELGPNGTVSLVRAGESARSEPPFWSAPLASPFEAVANLSEEALATLLAGELAIRIEIRGLTVEGGIGTPIFDDGFDIFSMCRWSNFPCPSDGNPCTDEVCSPTGACSHPNDNTNSCPLPNATGGCLAGICFVVTSCNSGYSHCDASNANGCETVHDTLNGACGTASNTFVGSKGGDLACGVGCPATSQQNFATKTGLAEAWYQAVAQENSSCSADLLHSVTLSVPDGVDWDLFLYDNLTCALVDSSVAGTGVDEQVGAGHIDVIGDDSFGYFVEVRYFSGHSCEEWTLHFLGRNCD